MEDHAKGIKVGDIITAYHKGYHRVAKVTKRYWTDADAKLFPGKFTVGEEYSSLIEYVPMLNSNGTKSTRKDPYECDAYYCSPAINEIDRQIEKLEQTKNVLEEFKKSIHSGKGNS